MSNISRTLYIGVTNNLERRVLEHKQKGSGSFTARYNITWLVYCAECDDVNTAIAWEKKLKGWTRAKKLALIEVDNPGWRDLSEDWFTESLSREYRRRE